MVGSLIRASQNAIKDVGIMLINKSPDYLRHWQWVPCLSSLREKKINATLPFFCVLVSTHSGTVGRRRSFRNLFVTRHWPWRADDDFNLFIGIVDISGKTRHFSPLVQWNKRRLLKTQVFFSYLSQLFSWGSSKMRRNEQPAACRSHFVSCIDLATAAAINYEFRQLIKKNRNCQSLTKCPSGPRIIS